MLRKGSELLLATGGDREVLLDLDYVTGNRGEPQTTDSYGSLQNGGFIPPRYVSVPHSLPDLVSSYCCSDDDLPRMLNVAVHLEWGLVLI